MGITRPAKQANPAAISSLCGQGREVSEDPRANEEEKAALVTTMEVMYFVLFCIVLLAGACFAIFASSEVSIVTRSLCRCRNTLRT